jgi:hypoxanthine phosphoribosyltransferase
LAILSITGETGSACEELGRSAAARFDAELINEFRFEQMIAEEFGGADRVPDKAWAAVLESVVARRALERHIVCTVAGLETLFRRAPGCFRVLLTGSESRRVGNLMIDRGLDRAAARELHGQMEEQRKTLRRNRFGRASFRAHDFDLMLGEDALDGAAQLAVIEAAVRAVGLFEQGLLSGSAEAQIQFRARMCLARFGLLPPAHVESQHPEFSHESEEIFARLLDFYQIPWEYEPRSFPLQWDKEGRVIEAFTPDFYLPQFDLYVELTTMKQALVTKKNRKIKLLRSIYPHVNIQVFYQRDVQDLISKYGLSATRISS